MHYVMAVQRISEDILNFVIIPLCGFLSVFAMWLEIEDTALKYGLWWAMFGIFIFRL